MDEKHRQDIRPLVQPAEKPAMFKGVLGDIQINRIPGQLSTPLMKNSKAALHSKSANPAGEVGLRMVSGQIAAMSSESRFGLDPFGPVTGFLFELLALETRHQ